MGQSSSRVGWSGGSVANNLGSQDRESTSTASLNYVALTARTRLSEPEMNTSERSGLLAASVVDEYEGKGEKKEKANSVMS